MARHLDSSEQLGFEVDRAVPLASVAKVPLALVAYDQIVAGQLDPAQPVELRPEERTLGPTGLSLFEHPCTVAVGDLITMALAVSDNAATDALMRFVPPAEVTRRMRQWGWHDITLRHHIHELNTAVADLPDHVRSQLRELAVRAATGGGGHVVPQLDTSHANTGTAAALVRLLEAVWTDRVSVPAATARLRRTMAHQPSHRRLGAELISDLTSVVGKTGTFLNLRHEIGVVTTADGDRVAVAALTVSSVPAGEQPEVDAAIGAAARVAVEALTR
nr:serine hydrolase [Auraticoccus cholistanensis]